MENQSLNQALENSLNNETAVSVATETLEILIDQVLEDGMLKDIPMVGWIISGAKVITNAMDRIAIKKWLTFISNTKGATEEERQKFFSELSKHQEKKDRLFEKILLTLNRLDDIKKAEYQGKALLRLIKGHIDLVEYYRTCVALEAILLDDLEHFLNDNSNRPSTDEEIERFRQTSRTALEVILIKVGILNEEVKVVQNKRSGLSELERKIRLNRVGEILLFASAGVPAPPLNPSPRRGWSFDLPQTYSRIIHSPKSQPK